MIKNVIDRLEGMDKNRLNDALLQLVIVAEELGYKSKDFLNGEGTRDELINAQELWQKSIDTFYEEYIR